MAAADQDLDVTSEEPRSGNGAQPNPPAAQPSKLGSPWTRGWRLTLTRILTLAAAIAITVYIFSIRDRAEELAIYGYPGIFLLSILANGTLFLPAPGVAFVFTMGSVFPPLPVALAAGAGAAIGELTGFMAGFSGRSIVERSKFSETLERHMRRYGGLTIFVLAVIPNPLFDLGGILAGMLRMRVTKFLFWCWLGKTVKMLAFAYAGAYAFRWLLR